MRIHELELLAADLAAQRAFYTERLGLTVIEQASETLTLAAGASRLIFRQAPPGWREVYHFAFNIPENRFDEAREWLAARTPLRPNADGRTVFHFDEWNADAVYFTDAGGNIGELIARHTLPNATSRPFTARDLLSVSEIGLATDDVPATVAMLRAELGVSAYGSESDQFTAVGDPEGLLIVVKRGRVWLSEPGMSAASLPTSAIVEAPAGRRILSGPRWAVQDA
jgi:catechol-2,3-dioxygenase